MLPKGCSTTSRRRSRISGLFFRRSAMRSSTAVRLPLLVLCVASMSAYPEESVVVAIDDGPALITIRLHHRFVVPQKEERWGRPHFAWPACLLSLRARFNPRARTAAAKIGEARPLP